jgi:nicotinate-nucleotide adenylyltransferase
MPAGDPPHKPLAKGASTEDRLEMVKLAISSCPRFVCSDIEICRNGPSFAVETLNILHRAYPQTHWFWIIGADAARDLPSWYRIHDLVHLCDWIVLSRPGATSAETELQRLRGILAIRGIPLDSTEADISSTQVRESVRSGRGLNSLVPAAVESYIRTHNLYADSTALR